jgi:hypothetical protein
MKMKNLFTLAILSIATTAAAQEGTSSVLVNATETSAPVACCETAKLVKLPAWRIRRLNRIADRQEAREARKCCCDPCACENTCDCNCRTRTIVAEARR